MKKINIRKQIAALLSASMVFAMLAPALPAYAAPNPITNINFDLGMWKYYEGKQDIVLSGEAASEVSAKYIQADGVNGGYAQNSNGHLLLPFMDADGNFTGKPEVSPPVAATPFGNSSSNLNKKVFDFSGYKLEGWYESQDAIAGGNKKTYIPKRFNWSDITYIPNYISDGTTKYKLRITHTLTGISGVTFGDLNTQNTDLFVLEGYQAQPKIVPGFKISAGYPQFNFYEPGGTFATLKTPPTGLTGAAAKYNNFGAKSENGYVSGLMTNKDLKVDFQYEPDQSVTFPVTVIHHVLNADETEKNPPDNDYEVSRPAYVNQPLSSITPALVPKVDYISGTPSKYNLITSGTHAPKFTTASGQDIQAATTLHQTNLLHPDDTHLTVNATTGAVTGNMVNFGLQLHYYYKPNPAYFKTVTVRYQNELSQDITDKVITKLNTVAPGTILDNYDSTNPTKFYKNANAIERRVSPNETFEIAAPALEAYKDDAGLVTANGVGTSFQTFQMDGGNFVGTGWHKDTQPKFTGTMGASGESVEIVVNYVHKNNAFATLLLQASTGGKLMHDASTEYSQITSGHPISKDKDLVTGTVKVDLAELPTPAPEPGYTTGAWYRVLNNNTKTKIENSEWPIDLAAPYKLEYKFEEVPGQWLNITFALGNLTTPVQNYALDITPNPFTGKMVNTGGNLTLNDFRAADQLPYIDVTGSNPDYTYGWFNSMGQRVNDTDSLAGYANQTLYLYPVYIGAVGLRTPTVEAKLDALAVPVINIANINQSSTVQYAITDVNGNVVAVMTAAALSMSNGNIQGNYLHPGDSYKVYEVAPGASVTVGAPITDVPDADRAAPADATIPVVRENPTAVSVTEDPSIRGTAQIVISPTSPSTQYALVDDAGNTVYGFTDPANNKIVFGGLDSDKNYRVVARQQGENYQPADRLPGYQVSTANLGILADRFDVTVVYPNGAEPTVMIDGQVHSLTDLTGIEPGKAIEITAQAMHPVSGEFFDKWLVIGTAPAGGRQRGNAYVFTMPRHPVKIQAIYPSPAHWANPAVQYQNLLHDNKAIDAVTPYITEAGDYRILITKSAATESMRNAAALNESSPYTALWLMKLRVEKKDSAGNWQLYPMSEPISTTIETGALISSKRYKLHKVDMATPSSASEISENITDYIKSPLYPGRFDIMVENDAYYTFGYVEPKQYIVTILDSRNNSLVKKLVFYEDIIDSVGSYSSSYMSSILPDYIDSEGIKWSYEGLSESKDRYRAYDTNLPVTGDMTLYLFYKNDRKAREAAAKKLERFIAEVQRTHDNSFSLTFKAKAAPAIAVALAVLNKTNPKASTQELLDAVKALEAATGMGSDFNSSGGGGSSGGSFGGGSGGGSGGGIVDNLSVHVGYDGNWELVDALNHIWNFNLTNGSKLKGWARLSYTYNEVSRTGWYHFNDNNIMDSGWYNDSNLWYYLSEIHDGFFGEMKTGWHFNQTDSKWYYLNPGNGRMLTGWQLIDGKWYYLSPNSDSGHPYGSLYVNETTPDGYNTNSDGVWN